MHKIDFGFISKLEGGQRLDGYVPAASTSQSGVTIATGFDLGARNEKDLRALGFSDAIVRKLSPYLGKKTGEAAGLIAKRPLRITKIEADVIDHASKRSAADRLATKYDQAVRSRSGRVCFAELFPEAQTVVASVSFQYGDLASRTPKFWKLVTEQDWRSAILELRSFGDAYANRRTAEATLLDRGLFRSDNTAPSKGGGPQITPALFGSIFGTASDRKTLTGSVGKGGQNAEDDVRVVRRLLNGHLRAPLLPLPESGPVDARLIDAIKDFQRRVVGLPTPDGRVDPGGKTLKALGEKDAGHAQTGANTAAVHPTTTAPQSTTGAQKGGPRCFPFTAVTKWSWEEAPRAFGSIRSKGARAHGGCDLYYPVGTSIHAVADGKVLRGPYAFYCQTYALEVDHGDFVVRYGEIGSAVVKAGATVKMGQKIATVGHLVGITVASDMLHFEMFAGTATGALSDTSAGSAKRTDGIPFQRRKDLLDPTPFLNEWKNSLPKP